MTGGVQPQPARVSYTPAMTTRMAVGLAALLMVAAAGATPRVPAQPGRDDASRTKTNQGWADTFGGYRTFTKPSRDSEMGFSIDTEIREILVTAGSRVRKGDLLMRGLDAEALAAVALAKLRAENDLEIKSEQVNYGLTQIEFETAERTFKGGGSNQQEFDRAKYTRDGAKIRVEAAEKRLEEQQQVLLRAEGELERFRLRAPYDGVVESISADTGHIAPAGRPVMRVVNIDRLWIEVPTPTEEAMRLGLKNGHSAWVVMDVLGAPKVHQGEVIAVSPVADFPSQKVNVKIEIGNPDGVMAGLTAWVRFTAPDGEWSGRIVERTPDATRGRAVARVNAEGEETPPGRAMPRGTP